MSAFPRIANLVSRLLLIGLFYCLAYPHLVRAENPLCSSQWLESTQQPARAVAVVVHGLNNRADVMDPLIASLQALGVHALRITLAGHCPGESSYVPQALETWTAQLSAALQEAHERYPDLPRLLVGFSMGGALAVAGGALDSSITADGLLLIAPALSLSRRSKMLYAVTWLHHLNLGLPSVAKPRFRAHRFVSFDIYRGLLDAIYELECRELPTWETKIPALVVLSDDDTLVSSAGVRDWIALHHLSNWELLDVPAPSAEYGHMILDEDSLGNSNWKVLNERVEKFLARVARPPMVPAFAHLERRSALESDSHAAHQ